VLTRHETYADTTISPGASAVLGWDVLDGRLRIIGGADLHHDTVLSRAEKATADNDWVFEPLGRGNFSDGSTYLSAAAFAYLDADLVRRKDSVFAANAGARLTHVRARADAVPGIGGVDYRHAGAVATAGLRYLYGDRLNLYLNFSQGFRAPGLEETTRLGSTGSNFCIPNDDLGPERAHVLEGGVRLNFKALRLHLSGFGSWMRGLLEREEVPEAEWLALGVDPDDVAGLPVTRWVNAAKGLYRGAEAHVVLPALWRFSLWAQAGLLWGDVTSSAGTEQPARRIPPPTGGAGLRYEDPRHRFYAEVYTLWAAAQERLNDDDEIDLRICGDPERPGVLLDPCPGTPGWITLNVRGGYRPLDWLRFDLVVENLTDARYKIHGSGIYGPGVNALLTATVDYGAPRRGAR